MSGIPYTKEQLAFMEKHGADMTTIELTSALNKAFHTSHTAASVRTTLKNMGILKSKETRARSCAMNGEPIGASKIINGYRYIKVRKSSGGFYKDWEREIKLVYKEAYGDIPDGCMVVTLDGNSLNAAAENLIAIPKSIAARMANGRGKSMWSKFPEITKSSIEVCKLDQAIFKSNADKESKP